MPVHHVRTAKRCKQSNFKQKNNKFMVLLLKSIKVIIQSTKLVKNIKKNTIPCTLLTFAAESLHDSMLPIFCVFANGTEIWVAPPDRGIGAAVHFLNNGGSWGKWDRCMAGREMGRRVYLPSYINRKYMRARNQGRGPLVCAKGASVA